MVNVDKAFTPDKLTGAIYGVVGVPHPPERPPGQWNSMNIRCEGDTVEVTLNGTRTAVGLGNETGSTPQERNNKKADVFPWGAEWPPPRGAGNYAPDLHVDDFGNTSPVGSFAMNRFGLYDMGGNVCQWCEDFYDGQSGERVLRGACWFNAARHLLLSTYRAQASHDQCHMFRGFRCVLAGGGVSASR